MKSFAYLGKRIVLKSFNFFTFPVLTDWISRRFFETEEQVVVLTYHRVAPRGEDWELPAILPSIFERELEYLNQHYHVISLDELVRALRDGFKTLPEKHGRRFVVVTFDDGYKDNYDFAFPLLKKYSIPATFYISTGFIENSETVSPSHKAMHRHSFMTWQNIQEISHDSLMTIGAHTVTHPRLTSISLDQVKEEMVFSKNVLEEKLNTKVTTFAYPFGTPCDYSTELGVLAKSVGFDSAVTVLQDFNTERTNPFEIRRVIAGFSLMGFKSHLSIVYARVRRLC